MCRRSVSSSQGQQRSDSRPTQAGVARVDRFKGVGKFKGAKVTDLHTKASKAVCLEIC